jgi:hypothetical protein
MDSNVVRVRVRDEPASYAYREETKDSMWRLEGLYRFEAWPFQDCRDFCSADPLCHGFQWLDDTAASASDLHKTLSLLGELPLPNYTRGSARWSGVGGDGAGVGGNGVEALAGSRRLPRCFFFEKVAAYDDVYRYVSNARVFVRTVEDGKCFADASSTSERVVFLDVRIVPKADNAPLLSIPHMARMVYNSFHPLAPFPPHTHIHTHPHICSEGRREGGREGGRSRDSVSEGC